MDFADKCHGKTITYEDFSKHSARFSYPSVDEKGFMLVGGRDKGSNLSY